MINLKQLNLESIFDATVKVRSVTLIEEFPAHDLIFVYRDGQCIFIDTESMDKPRVYKNLKECLTDITGMDPNDPALREMYEKVTDKGIYLYLYRILGQFKTMYAAAH